MKGTKLLAGLLTASMILSASPAVYAADEISEAPIINVTFDDGGDAYTLHGGTLVNGRNGKALSLDGSSQYADINGIADKLAAVSGDFTISVWCNPSAITTWSRIFDFGNGSSGTYVFLTPSTGANPRLAMTNNGIAGEQVLDSASSLSTGIWHNVTVTRNGTVTTFYIDGIASGTTSAIDYKFSEIGVMDNYYLGKSQFDADPYFSGMIDDFTVYDYALTEAEVQTVAAEAYESYRNSIVYKNSCYLIDTHLYTPDGTEIFSIAEDLSEMYVSDKNITESGASFTLHNAMDEDVSRLTAYLCCYDETGVLNCVKILPVSDIEITTDSQTVTVPYTADGASKRLWIWNNMTPLAEADSSVTVKTSVENCTVDNGTVTAEVYALNADGAETKVSETVSADIPSIESKTLEMTVAKSDIPKDTEKLVVKVTAPDNVSGTKTYTASEVYTGIKSPVAAPADSDSTTNGAHDPSIVKFPNDDTYYVYSSHHLIFTSDDLVNWKKYDFTSKTVQEISPVTYNFISNNYTGTTVNGTYWAPDVIYMPEDSEHPYWMYISVSCGLGGRNSAISLMKSSSPLFWADSNADIVDAGVVFATKENNNYKTNAIDANIYKDKDGKMYFIWGSFWGGIQAANLTSDGFVEGINYTSATTLLSTCQNFGKTVYAQYYGIAGPEGAWMIENGNYRYMFTSYGWLGSNYNTRIARSALSTSFSNVTASTTGDDTSLKDADNISVGTEYSKGSTSVPSGYKLIGSYRLGDGSMEIEGDDNDYYISRDADDAHIYYGPGHNSAINTANGESFYVSHTRKDAVEGAAVLQTRKMMWLNGWPVVSPVTYAGEKEQALPKEMLTGTYDLAAVGQTKTNGTTIKARNFDLPVLSSKITLNADGTLSDSLGTWSFDGDHTVTIRFTKDGDASKDEFYKNGDVLTMYALFGYDKDEKEPVIALTGLDNNNITQFAKKSMSSTIKTDTQTVSDTTVTSITKSVGGNPILGFDGDGNTVYAGDPAATVIGNTVYIIAGHDASTAEVTDSSAGYLMPEWLVYKSTDLENWEYVSVAMKASDISWRNVEAAAWASQMVEYNGKYYLYFCTWDKTSEGKQSIGVAVADKPEGPYTDIGAPLVKGTFTTPETSGWNDIDPTVLIDTDENGDEHRYLAWGNGKYYICELNEDMTSVKDLDGDGEIVMHKDVVERKIKSMPDGSVFTEAPWLYKRDGKYYMFYAMNWREEMAYAMADSPMGRYDYIQTLMPPAATSNTNHPSVIDFKGKTYFIYHNGALPRGFGFRRSVCIEELHFDENGYVYPLSETSIGLMGTASTLKSSSGKYIAHSEFRNPYSDSSYPLSVAVTAADNEDGYNTAWELVEPKYVPDGESADNYVSIQSVNKPGLYLSAKDKELTLTADYTGNQGAEMTFKTVKGLDGLTNTVSFESVSNPDMYLTVLGGTTMLSYGTGAKDASFVIADATEKDEYTIDVAEPETEPNPEADTESDFDSVSTGTIMSIQTTDQGANTSYPGIELYIGTRGSGADSTTSLAVASGVGVNSSNALVMNSGKFASSSRGPRLKFVTPVIPNGYIVTASASIKLGSDAAELYWGDSTSSQATTAVTGLSASAWSEFKVTITNDNDVYTRAIYVNDEVVYTDYADVFPVLWGTATNSTNYKVYFDNISVKTTTATGETPVIPQPEPVAFYTFDDTLADSVSGESATVTGATVSAVSDEEVSYTEGADGKAVEFTGEGSYGLELASAPTGSDYTISFDAKLNASTIYTPFIFLANYSGTTLKGDDTNAQWISISPQGWQSDLSSGPMVWSRDVTGGNSWNDLVPSTSNSLSLDTWHNITVSVTGTTAKVYVDKLNVGSGNIAAIIDSTTKVFVGVNNWNTPLNGVIDNIRIYDSALSAGQVQKIGE